MFLYIHPIYSVRAFPGKFIGGWEGWKAFFIDNTWVMS
jgi:hypothetical protein